MKIGILTQPLGHNYGGILQNYALQQTLEKLGYQPITLQYTGMPLRRKAILYPRNLITYILKHAIFHPTRHFNQLPWDTRPYSHFKRFIKRQITVSKYIEEISESRLKKEGITTIVVGSVQVWRPCYNGSHLKDMFCSFLSPDSSIPVIAYAASFGTSEWEFTDSETIMAKQGIAKFSLVSVREDSGVSLCKEKLGREAIHVLDPTLLLTPSDYNSLIADVPVDTMKDCVGAYILDMTPEKHNLIEAVCKQLGKEPYIFERPKNNKTNVPGIEHWLAMFKNCSFIITDSFHGTAFSINYNKPFISIVNHERGADRFTSLLSMTDLTDRMVESIDSSLAVTLATKTIDWIPINSKINNFKTISLNVLNHTLPSILY